MIDYVFQFSVRNNKGIKAATTRSKPLAFCKLTVGDIYLSILHFYREQLRHTESNLSDKITNHSPSDQSTRNNKANNNSLIIPSPQEYSLFRPCKEGKSLKGDIFEAIDEEMASIQKAEDALNMFDSDSDESDWDTSFLGDGGSVNIKEKGSDFVAHERLYGSVALSFFPVPW